MKKILLGLGTLAAVVTPVATVVACGSTSENGNPGVTPGDHTNGADGNLDQNKYPDWTDSDDLIDDLENSNYNGKSVWSMFLEKKGISYFSKYDYIYDKFFKTGMVQNSNYEAEKLGFEYTTSYFSKNKPFGWVIINLNELYDFANNLDPKLYPYL